MKKVCWIMTGLFLLLIVMSLIITIFQKKIPLSSKIALVRVEGPLFDSRKLVEEISDYVKNASVKAIVLRIDSPGGAVAPSQEIHEAVRKAVAQKKVVVSMGSIAASGGYYIAAPATKIIANPGTLTGSIDVIMEIPNVESLMSKIGIKTEVIKSGKHKDIGSAFRSMEKEEREMLQGVMDNVHEQFMKAVAVGRKLDMEDVRKIADGRIFTGEQAIQFGLVDEIGTLDDAISEAALLVGIKGEPEIVTKEDRFSLLDILNNKLPKELGSLLPVLKIKYLYLP